MWRGILLVLVWVAASGTSWADTVDDLRESVNEPSAPSDPPEPKKKWHWADPKPDDQSEDNSEDGPTIESDLFWAGSVALGTAVTSPFWAPAALVDGGQQRIGWFTRFPYQFGDSYMKFEQPLDAEHWVPEYWSLRAETDFGTDFDNQQFIGGHLLWEHQNRFGIDTRMNFLEDRFPGARDHLYFGDLNGTYRFAQSEHWLFRGGVGANWLSDHGESDLGVNFTYQVDWFPADPFVFSTDVDVGTLGDATLFHFQQTAGITWRGLETRIGYDYLDVGDAQFSLLICGVRGWF